MTGALRLDLGVDEALVAAFAAMTGDFSPVHMDAEFARTSRYRGRISHGMLPVAAAMLALSGRDGSRRARSAACRFLKPLKIGEAVQITAEGDGDRFRLRVADRAGETVTEGEIGFAAGAPAPLEASAAAGPDYGPVAELRIGDIATDQAGSLPRVGARAGAPGFLQILAGRQPGPWPTAEEVDPNILALARASALVGMRLPGRHATFLDFEACLRQDLDADAELSGRVESAMKASGRLRLQLSWTNRGAAAGSGSAGVAVNPPAPTELLSAEISAGHRVSGLEGRVALITGASRGIGAATARLAALHGVKVAVHFFRGAAAAEAVADDIRSQGGDAFAVGADLADAEAVGRMFEAVESRFGGVDILVNNAVGAFTPKPFAKATSEDFLSEIGVSLTGAHACCARATPHMRRQGWGRIINLGTVATETPPAGQAVYVSVKSALTGYTRALAAELARDGVRVNLVVPHMTGTSLLASLPAGLADRLAGESVAGRLLQPIEVARPILFLMSDAAEPITGQRLVIGLGEGPFL